MVTKLVKAGIGKQGYIKTLEAVIAIVIILIFTFAVTPKPQPSYALPSSIENAQDYILEEIARDEMVRKNLINVDMGEDLSGQPVYGFIDEIVSANMPAGFDYLIGICEESACAATIGPRELPAEKSIYTAEAMISAEGAVPKIVRIWMWRK